MLPLSAPAHAQQVSGSGWAAVAGGTLGLFSGAVLGFGGSAIPCSQTRAGVRCVRAAVISGGLIGFAAGLAMGAGDEEAVKRAARGAGFGFAAGSAVGFVLMEVVPHYGWLDVLTAGGIGAAIGSSARGAAIGLGAGAVVGVVLWRAIPAVELPDAVGMGLMGMAVGGLAGWVVRAVDAQSEGAAGPPLVLSFRLSL